MWSLFHESSAQHSDRAERLDLCVTQLCGHSSGPQARHTSSEIQRARQCSPRSSQGTLPRVPAACLQEGRCDARQSYDRGDDGTRLDGWSSSPPPCLTEQHNSNQREFQEFLVRLLESCWGCFVGFFLKIHCIGPWRTMQLWWQCATRQYHTASLMSTEMLCSD